MVNYSHKSVIVLIWFIMLVSACKRTFEVIIDPSKVTRSLLVVAKYQLNYSHSKNKIYSYLKKIQNILTCQPNPLCATCHTKETQQKPNESKNSRRKCEK